MKEEEFPADVPIFWTIGAFDGVHLGHQALIHATVNLARATQKKSGVLTFSPHPDVVLKKRTQDYITTEEEKKEILHNLGVDYVWTIKFTRELARFTWKKFLDEYFLPKTLCAGLIVGQDFTFGYKAEGNASLLKEYMTQKGVRVEICAEVQCKGRKVSSTWVRETLMEGRVDLTRMLLGRPYTINSTVIKGSGRGKKLGFPTMNLSPVPEKILP
ncbi:MAG: riboflavin kinase, partial [bacterium]